ncbi:MAG: polyphosphate kinase 2 family protein [Chlorobium phaeobacteroides]|uniref:Polyphosphate kinase-2-related domain-containing protein n=1 Tax=Chlorobium phaeobacteroides (strain BS1) TaxID=331678 RepID=B3EQU3_CHLPB|nr:polyphosphate kinase 2 family protein [Chlorobium phaeobacteroides]NEX14762.1 polyphosphate kinase 2 family protein [Prosthecochloris sp.]
MGDIRIKDFRVQEGRKVSLNEWPTRTSKIYSSKEQYREILKKHVEELSELQRIHYADNRYAVLLIFQAMDAAGKDGAIRHVMSGINPQGCQVFSFKHPSPRELDHDFLWRTNCSLPERGKIGIFNRSYYEEVLIVRVHPEILMSQQIPEDLLNGEDVWKDRFRSINNMEHHLYHNGTRIVKFFLHLSREEQRQRFLRRIDSPEKNWKFSIADIEERKCWNRYMAAYEDCISETSTERAPWYIVPADDKKNARLIVSKIILETFLSLNMSYPETGKERRQELLKIRELLVQEGKIDGL